jgi:hypothetical protein
MTVIAPWVSFVACGRRKNALARYFRTHIWPLGGARAFQRWAPALVIGLFVGLSACTGDRLEGASKGWSPAAVSSQLQESRVVVSEGLPFSESDTTLTVTGGSALFTGQTIVLGSEQLVVTSISGSDLRVVRGANGTLAQAHADGSPVSVLTDDVVTVYVTTKQGELKVLEDDGFGPPESKWTFRPLGDIR